MIHALPKEEFKVISAQFDGIVVDNNGRVTLF